MIMLALPVLGLLLAAGQALSYSVPKGSHPSAGLSLLEIRQDDITETTADDPWDGEYNVTTRIGWYKGCSNSQTDTIKQAWKDAMMLANAIGNPSMIQPWDTLTKEFFGDYRQGDARDYEKNFQHFRDNLGRIQEQMKQSWWRDWYDGRKIRITCGNKNDKTDSQGRGCSTPGVRAHVLRRKDSDKNHDNMDHDTVVICDSYFDFETTKERVKLLDDDKEQSIYNRKDVKMLISQGSMLLHELIHTGNNNVNPGGFLKPAGRDIDVGNDRGVATGAARSKWLARNAERFGFQFAVVNVDCYVYYAIARFMHHRYFDDRRFEEPLLPKFGWPRGVTLMGEVTDETLEDDGLTDEDRNNDGPSKPCDDYDDCKDYCPLSAIPVCGTEGTCVCGNQHPVLMAVPAANDTQHNQTGWKAGQL